MPFSSIDSIMLAASVYNVGDDMICYIVLSLNMNKPSPGHAKKFLYGAGIWRSIVLNEILKWFALNGRAPHGIPCLYHAKHGLSKQISDIHFLTETKTLLEHKTVAHQTTNQENGLFN